jgi:hypothetical protein
MRMKDGASSGEEKILTDVPITGIWVECHCSSNDFDGDREPLFANFWGELVEIEKMFMAEDDDAAIGSHRIEVRKTYGLSNADPSFGGNLIDKLRCFKKYIFRTEKTPL